MQKCSWFQTLKKRTDNQLIDICYRISNMRHKKDQNNSTVILPTLNEAENIKQVISELLEECPDSDIIVADDGSVDGTDEIVRRMSKTEGRIIFLDRKNRKEHGLTASVIDAVLIAKGAKIAVMDADRQHPVALDRSGQGTGSEKQC